MKKILIIDDDEQICEMIDEMLKNKYETKVCHSVDDVIKYCSKNEVDLVITDLFMPKKNGLDLLEELNKENSTVGKKPRFLAMSGGSYTTKCDFLPVAELLGASKTLKKPFTKNMLHQNIDEILNSEAS